MPNIRMPSVAGQFYPESAEKLSLMIDGFLSGANRQGIESLKALIVPHAGYPCSGHVAGYAYKLFQALPQEGQYNIIMLGPCHGYPFEGVYADENDFWQTPLGKVPLLSQTVFPKSAFYHQQEHSLEVQVPFLQKTLKNFKILPLVYRSENPQELSQKLSAMLDENTILIASGDLSHYLSYDDASRIDRQTCENILDLNAEELSENKSASCGLLGILTFIEIARIKNWRPKLLKYENSGDTCGDKDSVVGYCAFCFLQKI